jgi:probable HAF family extracellular repeat protein
MKILRGLIIAIVTVAVGIAGATPSHAASVTYTITNLGTLAGTLDVTTEADAINNSGQIVGTSQVVKNGSYAYHAYLWSHGSMTDLGIFKGGDQSEAHAIDKMGDVAGTGTICQVKPRCVDSVSTFTYTDTAVLWQNGTLHNIDTFGDGCSFGYGINDSGQVVGKACTPSGNEHAFLYSGGKMTDLGSLAGPNGPISGANDINNLGQVVGESETSFTFSSTNHAFLWSNGKMTDLGTLGGTESFAYAINDSSQIVGAASITNGPEHAFLDQNGKMTDLGAFGDGSVALAVNSSGIAVGWADLQGANRATIFGGGTIQDLNTLIPAGSGVDLYQATGINDHGQIICDGVNADGYENAFLLTPQ